MRRFAPRKVETFIFYAGFHEGAFLYKALGSFRARGPDEPLKLAKLAWPEPIGFELKVWQRRLIDKDLETIDMPYVDCAQCVQRRMLGANEAAQRGHANAMICAFCGCWELHACAGGCWWAAPNLCSACCRTLGINPVVRAQLEPAGWESAVLVKPLSPGKGAAHATR